MAAIPRCLICGAVRGACQHPQPDDLPIIPANPTGPQLEAQAKALRRLRGRQLDVYSWIDGSGRHMSSSYDYAEAHGISINKVNPIFTRLHQKGLIIRTKRERPNAGGNNCALYTTLRWWRPEDGHVPSEPHKGIGQERDPTK